MVTVPVYERTQELRPAYQQGVDVQANAEDFGAAAARGSAAVGEGLQRLAGGIDNAGDALARVQALDDSNAAKDADNQYSDWLRNRMYGDGGFLTLEGKNAVDARQQFEQDVQEQRKQFGASLSPGAAMSYERASTARTQSALSQAIIHTAQARKQWFNDSSDARLDTFSNDALASYSNPDLVNKNIAAGLLEIEQQGHMNGWDNDALQDKQSKYISGVRSGVAMRIAETDPIAANDYVTKFRDQLTGTDQYKLDQALGDAVRDEQSKREADAILSGGRAIPPTSDSGGDAGSDTSRAFLLGKLTDKTRTEDVTGLTGNFATNLAAMLQDAPPAIRDGLGILSGYRSYDRQAQLYENSDKSGHTVAAPGTSMHEAGQAADLSWNGQSLTTAPKDVQDWVHQNAGKYGLYFPMTWEPWHIQSEGASSATVSPRTNDVAARTAAPSYTDIESKLDGISDPRVRDLTRKRIYAQLEMQNRASEANQKAARDQLWSYVLGGKTPDQVPLPIKQAAGMDAVSSAWSYVRQGGNDRVSDPTLLYQMRRYAASNPDDFAKVDLNTYRDRLSKQDIDSLTTKQTAALSDQRKAMDDGASLTTAFSQADTALEAVGITTTGLKGSARQTAAQRIAQFHNALTDQIEEYGRTNPGKKPSQPEVQQMINRLLLPVVIKTPGTFWDSNQNAFAFEAGSRPDNSTVTPNVQYADVPIDLRRKIGGDLERELRRKPSEQEIAARYADFVLGR